MGCRPPEPPRDALSVSRLLGWGDGYGCRTVLGDRAIACECFCCSYHRLLFSTSCSSHCQRGIVAHTYPSNESECTLIKSASEHNWSSRSPASSSSRSNVFTTRRILGRSRRGHRSGNGRPPQTLRYRSLDAGPVYPRPEVLSMSGSRHPPAGSQRNNPVVHDHLSGRPLESEESKPIRRPRESSFAGAQVLPLPVCPY